jgi:uncharacterized protein YlxW (UPF0749 family)
MRPRRPSILQEESKLAWKLNELKRLQQNQAMLNQEINKVRSEIDDLRPFSWRRLFCLTDG